MNGEQGHLSHLRSLVMKGITIFAIAMVCGFSPTASASPAAQVVLPGVGLDTLLDDGSIQVGDKIFSDFSIDGFDAAGVTVIGIQENGAYGLRLQGGFAAFGNSSLNFSISFSVAVAAESSELIAGVQLDFNGAVLIGNGSASVEETAVNESNEDMLVPTLLVVNPPPTLSASADLVSPQKKIYVTKEIELIAGGYAEAHKRLGISTDTALNAVAISQIDQLFPQIPEPGTVVLVAAGLLGVAMTGRRRK